MQGSLAIETSNGINFVNQRLHWKTSFFLLILLCFLTITQQAQAAFFSYENTTSDTIPDNSCSTNSYLTKTINVTDSFTIADVNLGFVADHSLRGDLRLRLTSPSGTTVTLINESSTTRWNYDVLLNDHASVTVNTDFHDSDNDSSLIPYYYEISVKPNSPFSAFSGESSSGAWTISMCDTTTGDTGVFQRAKLTFFDGNSGSGASSPLSCGATAKTFDWDTVDLTTSNLDQTFTNIENSGVDINWKLIGRTDLLINATPDDLSIFSSPGGVGGDGESYSIIADPANSTTDGTSPVTSVVSFSQPVTDLRFSIFDIDASNPSSSANGRVDKVTITGTDGTNTYTPTLVAVNSNPSFSISGNVATAPQEFDSQSNNDTRGTLDIYFSNPVNSISVVYEEGGNADAPYGRGIGISNLTFCAGVDYGDAPITGPSPNGIGTNNYGEASHGLVVGSYMGFSDPDFEESNQPGTNANNDDNNGSNDEDGVFIDAAFSLGLQGRSFNVEDTVTLHIPVSGSGDLSAWIDWNGDGDFDDVSEHIANSIAGSDETLTVVINVPLGAHIGSTYARFRFSSDAAAASPTGFAVGGEVEDYQITIANIPTAPTSSEKAFCTGVWVAGGGGYQSTTAQDVQITATATSSANSNWVFSPNDALNISGTFSETAFNGAPSLSSTFFWDTSPEDRRTEDAVSDGETGTMTFSFNVPVKNPIIHFDRVGGSGGSLDSNPQILSNSAVITPNVANSTARFTKLAGSTHFVVTPSSIQRIVNETLVWGENSSQSGDDSTRYTAMGSVEVAGTYNSLSFDFNGTGVEGDGADSIEFVVCARPYDYGDAPDSYGEAAHLLSDSTIYLGNVAPDREVHSLNASNGGVDGLGDDNDTSHDEGGITLKGQSLSKQTLEISEAVQLVANTHGSGTLYGWIDWNGNGNFTDSGEEITNGGIVSTGGSISFEVTPPASMTTGTSYARFRYSSDVAAANPSGDAADGEVEDYQIILSNGFQVSGRVFIDHNVDTINDVDEKGVSDLPVVLRNISMGTCMSTRTDAQGNYAFFPVKPGNYEVYEASRETVPEPQLCDNTKAKDPLYYRSTTANVSTDFTVSNSNITNIDFGDVKEPEFKPDHSGTVLPGNVVYYAHRFTPRSAGVVTFSLTPVTSQWSSILYQDSDCNGTLDGTEANTAINNPVVTTANTNVCLINKVYAPNNVVAGETYSNVITADFNFNGNTFAGSTTMKVTDLSTASANEPVTPTNPTSGSSKLELRKTVQNITQGTDETEGQNQAKPGDTLKYRIYYSNSGNAPLTDLIINDVVPDFTVLNGGPFCDTPLPDSFSTCTPAANDSDITWTFPSEETLEAGAQGSVSYSVEIE